MVKDCTLTYHTRRALLLFNLDGRQTIKAYRPKGGKTHKGRTILEAVLGPYIRFKV